MLEFDFNISYKPGSQNVSAHTLSRRSATVVPDNCLATLVLSQPSREEIRAAQLQDEPPLSSTNFLHHIRCQVREPQTNQKCLDTASSGHNWRSLVESSASVTSQTLQWIQSLFQSCQSVYIRRHCFKHMMHLVQATRGQQKPCTDYDKSHIGWAWLGTLNIIAESASLASKLSLPYQRKHP